MYGHTETANACKQVDKSKCRVIGCGEWGTEQFRKQITLQRIIAFSHHILTNYILPVFPNEIIPQPQDAFRLIAIRQIQFFISSELQVMSNDSSLLNEGDDISLIIKRMLIKHLQLISTLAEIKQ